VSVGMLFDYSVLVREPLRLLEVLAIVVVGKGIVTFAITRSFGRPVRSALVISSSLAQIGEFSFILAGLGITLGILQEDARSLILGGAILSITINPLVMASANRVETWLEDRPSLLTRLEPREPAIDAAQVKSADAMREHVVL